MYAYVNISIYIQCSVKKNKKSYSSYYGEQIVLWIDPDDPVWCLASYSTKGVQ